MILEFIAEEFIVVVIVLYIIGKFIKDTKFIRNELIPFILIAIGILFCMGLDSVNVNAIIQGILCAGVSVLGNQSIKQIEKIKGE